MHTTENLEPQTPEKSTEFVHLPKAVHKQLIRNTILDALQESRLRKIFPNDYHSSSVDSLLWLLGFNATRVSWEFRGLIDDIFSKHSLSFLPENIDSEKLNKKIRKELKPLISLYQLKYNVYEE